MLSRSVLPMLARGVGWLSVLFFLAMVAWCYGCHGWVAPTSSSINSHSTFCRFGAGSQGMESPSSGHGNCEVGDLLLRRCCSGDMRQGSVEAAPESECMEVPCRLLSKMVEGRPLPSSSSATVFSDRRLQVISNPPGIHTVAEAPQL
jgi:hypothetical protein